MNKLKNQRARADDFSSLIKLCMSVCMNVLAVLRNDHKELTSSIERNIYILHSGGFTKDSTLPQKRTGVHYLIV
jgi:hypothetical protein